MECAWPLPAFRGPCDLHTSPLPHPTVLSPLLDSGAWPALPPLHPTDPQPGVLSLGHLRPSHPFGSPLGLERFLLQARRWPGEEQGPADTRGRTADSWDPGDLWAIWEVPDLHRAVPATWPHGQGRILNLQQLQGYGHPMGPCPLPSETGSRHPHSFGGVYFLVRKGEAGTGSCVVQPGPDQGGGEGDTGDSSDCAHLVPRLSCLGPGKACPVWWHQAWGQKWQASGTGPEDSTCGGNKY